MQTDTPGTVVATTVRSDVSTLFASLELSKWKWLVTVNSPGGEKFSRHAVEGGDGDSLLDLLARLRAKAERRCGLPVKVMVIQEAGLDGFWLHRLLTGSGIESRIVDPASIAVDRRHPAGKDGCDRWRDTIADAHGLDPRRAAGLLDGSSAEPGRGGPPAPDAGAWHATQGTHPAYQSHQRAAQRKASGITIPWEGMVWPGSTRCEPGMAIPYCRC